MKMKSGGSARAKALAERSAEFRGLGFSGLGVSGFGGLGLRVWFRSPSSSLEAPRASTGFRSTSFGNRAVL